MTSALHVDLYQLTSLIPHVSRGHIDDRVVMTFFSRRLPQNPVTGETVRGYLIWAGLQRCLDYLESARFSEEGLACLERHPSLGPALMDMPSLIQRLRRWQFSGTVHSPPEGTPIFAGSALRMDGTPLEAHGVKPAAYIPYLVIETDLLSAKLIETPLLSIINHMTMVASKAAHIVSAAREGGNRPVVEFGSRRTHPAAAVDAALAAYIGGCSATSNVEAHFRYGIPATGTMDHFAVQAWEQPDQPRHETEFAFFQAFHQHYPDKDTLLVDTYDTFGEKTGIRNAVAATNGGPVAIRIDSNITKGNLWKARQLLDGLGAIDTKILVSGGIDEKVIRELADAAVDGFGVGENLVVSSDAPVGVGAVGKLSMIRGHPTTKLAKGSGKAHLPGILQVWRTPEFDLVGLHDEHQRGEPLLQVVWDKHGRKPAPSWADVRRFAIDQLSLLPTERKQPRSIGLPVTDALAQQLEALASQI